MMKPDNNLKINWEVDKMNKIEKESITLKLQEYLFKKNIMAMFVRLDLPGHGIACKLPNQSICGLKNPFETQKEADKIIDNVINFCYENHINAFYWDFNPDFFTNRYSKGRNYCDGRLIYLRFMNKKECKIKRKKYVTTYPQMIING